MTLKPEAEPRHKMVSKKSLLWAVPLGLALLLVGAVLALPGFVSSRYHRATVEALASSLTGRIVHINGKVSLALLPQPQFIAGDITITNPDHETITAASLTLDIAPIPLLHGQISARAITLQSPHIALPWPLPGGAAAIAPPPWLTTLHAQINNGQISLGAVNFTHVSADIFTGGEGTFSISGTGDLNSAPVTVSLSFGALSAVGSTPLTLDIQTNNAANLQAHISGNFDASSTLTGTAGFSAATLSWLDPELIQPLSGTTTVTADPQQILLSDLKMQQGKATLAGTATISLPQPSLSLLLTGNNLTLPAAMLQNAASRSQLPTHLTLDAANVTLAAPAGWVFAHLQTSIDFNTEGATINAFTATLPETQLSLTGKLDRTGNLAVASTLDSTNLNTLIGGATPPLPAAWSQANLKFALKGTQNNLTIDNLAGSFGPARVSASAVLADHKNLSFQLHFDQLDLTPFIALMRQPPTRFQTSGWSSDFEITADHATIDKIPLAHLLADASLGHQLVVRRLSAAVYGGIAAASFTLAGAPAAGGQAATAQITSARAILALPSASQVAGLLPAWLRPPPALARAPLAFSFLAAGPADALATSASLTLGQISVTAAPVIDLTNQSASGAFTLRHPNAIAAFKALGLNAGLAWPGAGSISLRASLLLSPTQMGFSDFVLSMGALTANGALIYGSSDHQLNGQIDADTLALPPIAANFTPPWTYLAGMQGKIGIRANRVLLAGSQILGPAGAVITLGPGKFDLALAQAALAGGKLTGNFSAAVPAPALPIPGKTPTPPAPPAITAKFTLTGADAAAFNLPMTFPLTLPSGTLSAAIDLTASGYTPSIWLATLTGNASLAAKTGSISSFNLPALTAALATPIRHASQLRAACLAGLTPFSSLSLTSSIDSGIVTLTGASLQSPGGAATATGNIDLPDNGLTLNITLLPAVPSPPQLTLALDGSWRAPRKITAIQQGLSWKAPAK